MHGGNSYDDERRTGLGIHRAEQIVFNIIQVEPPQLQCHSVRFSSGVLYTCQSELELLVQLSLNHGTNGPHTRRNYTRDLFVFIFTFATSGTTRIPVVPWPNLLQMESHIFVNADLLLERNRDGAS